MVFGEFKEAWPKIIRAIEEGAPNYDAVNDSISLWQASRARRYALARSKARRGMIILDAGIGPGAMTKLMLGVGLGGVIALDASSKMLQAILNTLSDGEIMGVRGVFEALPFRGEVFHRIFNSFALEDSPDYRAAIAEFKRICGRDGLYIVINLGKPDNPLIRGLMDLYMGFMMPFISKIILGRMDETPWALLTLVYRSLPQNSQLLGFLGEVFDEMEVKKLLFGGVLVVLARTH